MITGNTTLNELQIELRKLGIDSLVWSVLANSHGITVVGPDGRIAEHGADFVDVLRSAISRYAEKVGVSLIFDQRDRVLAGETKDELPKYSQALRNVRNDKDEP